MGEVVNVPVIGIEGHINVENEHYTCNTDVVTKQIFTSLEISECDDILINEFCNIECDGLENLARKKHLCFPERGSGEHHLNEDGLFIRILLPGLQFINRPFRIDGQELATFLEHLRGCANKPTNCKLNDYVRLALTERFVPMSIDAASITRADYIAQHVTPFSNALYNPEPDEPNAIAIIHNYICLVPKKWQNLLCSYKTCKDNKKKSGKGPMRFEIFNKMDELLEYQPNISSPHSINSIVGGPENPIEQHEYVATNKQIVTTPTSTLNDTSTKKEERMSG
ncbi:hypothetical protein CBL_10112 [Carabus blaptoides fortunei]